ncbi:MAG TPA: TetR/AcrR family transcriptional regulator [Candidatus Acidoferrales bacterium]|nr:TetR/AcrR family transcriptional regulator [Candidatus Acidoferrales bacterium]
MTAAAAQARRTQEERSSTMRARLLDATVECLFELGFAKTTTTEIAKRAGVSRGAQLHHFPTKAELVITAVEYLLDKRHQEFLSAFASLPAEANRAEVAIDLLWSIVSGPTFFAWLELMVAARTDPELRPVVAQLSTRFAETVQRTFLDIFPRPQLPNPLYDIAPHFAFAVLQGLALDSNILPGHGHAEQVVEALKRIASLAISPSS